MTSTHLAKTLVLLAAIIAGGFFGYWGYRLYIQGVESSTAGGVTWQDASFWFNGAGPGIGFAVVGAAMVLVAVNRRFGEETDGGPGGRRHVYGSKTPDE